MRTEVKVFLAESYNCLPADVRAVGGKICRTFGVCLLSLGGCFDKSDKTTVESGNPEDADALFNLGVLYENGRGVPQDDAEAVKWYRKAAEQGSASAQYNLGLLYGAGQGVPQDYAEAVKWYRKPAEQGDWEGLEKTSEIYLGGYGVPKDVPEGMKWCRKAAEQGYPKAQ